MESRFEKRALYIQGNAGHYLDKFSIIETTGTKASWNWCAFLFTSAWMFYRKMYKQATLVMAVEFLLIPFLTYMMGYIPVPLSMAFNPLITGIQLLLSFGVNIVIGVAGNYIYMKHIDRLMDSEPLLDMNKQFTYQQKTGGTSWNTVIIYLVIALVLNSITESMFLL